MRRTITLILWLSAVCANTQDLPSRLPEPLRLSGTTLEAFPLKPRNTSDSLVRKLSENLQLAAPASSFPEHEIRFEPATPARYYFDRNPYAFDYRQNGLIHSWQTGTLTGFGSRTTLPGLMSTQSAGISALQQFGHLTLSGSITADRHQFFRGVHDRFGFHGAARWDFSEHVSLTVFGSYMTGGNPLFYSPAVLPFVGSSSYGGYFTLKGERFGISLGAERVYDARKREWETVPIVTPYVRIKKFKLELPVGWLIQELLRDTFVDDRMANPTIAPPIPPLPPVR